MDVHATLSIGVVAGDVVGDGGRRGLGRLFESHLACDFRVSPEDGDWREMSALRCRRCLVDCVSRGDWHRLVFAETRAESTISGALAEAL